MTGRDSDRDKGRDKGRDRGKDRDKDKDNSWAYKCMRLARIVCQFRHERFSGSLFRTHRA